MTMRIKRNMLDEQATGTGLLAQHHGVELRAHCATDFKEGGEKSSLTNPDGRSSCARPSDGAAGHHFVTPPMVIAESCLSAGRRRRALSGVRTSNAHNHRFTHRRRGRGEDGCGCGKFASPKA